MKRKIIVIAIGLIALMACDDDFKQGNCDEGFFEQTNGNGGTHCVPISEIDGIEDEDSVSENENLD